MTDNALDPDSLVGRMIHGWEPRPQSPEEVAAGLRQAFRKCIEKSFVSPLPVSAPPPATVEPLPLWRLIAVARISGPCNQRDIIAAEIEALRDWLLPSESAVISDSAPDDPIWARFNERQRLRSLLTEQARIARGEND
jgi:hypothetical protein